MRQTDDICGDKRLEILLTIEDARAKLDPDWWLALLSSAPQCGNTQSKPQGGFDFIAQLRGSFRGVEVATVIARWPVHDRPLSVDGACDAPSDLSNG